MANNLRDTQFSTMVVNPITFQQTMPQHNIENKTQFLKDFYDNQTAKNLNDNMCGFVYPRIKQIMKDFGLTTSIRSSIIKHNTMCLFVIDFYHGNLYINLTQINTTYNTHQSLCVLNDKCPIYTNIHDAHNLFSIKHDTTQMMVYVEFCNRVMDILDDLEKHDSYLKETFQRSKRCGVRLDRNVIFEKFKLPK